MAIPSGLPTNDQRIKSPNAPHHLRNRTANTLSLSEFERVYASLPPASFRRMPRHDPGHVVCPGARLGWLPMFSSRLSMNWSKTSDDTVPIFLPIRSVDTVQIWLIFTHECLGWSFESRSRARGNPAPCLWKSLFPPRVALGIRSGYSPLSMTISMPK